MPIFGYLCQDCKAEFELFYTSQSKVKLEEKNEQCPNCKSKKKQKLPPKNTSFVLKGDGWAKDGYSKP